ncbi:MAG: class I SAM-dependent methyltransferase [Candidatus Peribacteraceae bacterium]|nr:class I SAM-dependent methyltransferase [Candidatus Peribacteraceae bacterium]
MQQEGGWRCPATGDFFPSIRGVPAFVSETLRSKMESERTGMINRLKVFLRSFPRFYVFLIYAVSPVCLTGLSAKKFVRRFIPEATILNIGSGIHRLAPNVLNVDIYWYPGVDIIADAHALPLPTDSIDGVVCEFLLEHVPDPQRVVGEILRILKPGGCAYLAAPFVYPFHASPNDFQRWSREGMKKMCKGGTVEEIAPRSGPTSALVAQLGTWAAIIFSFGNEHLYGILTIVFTTLFSPLKWLDLIFGKFPTAFHGAASFYAVVRKPA